MWAYWDAMRNCIYSVHKITKRTYLSTRNLNVSIPPKRQLRDRCHKILGTPWKWGPPRPHFHRYFGDPLVKMGTPYKTRKANRSTRARRSLRVKVNWRLIAQEAVPYFLTPRRRMERLYKSSRSPESHLILSSERFEPVLPSSSTPRSQHRQRQGVSIVNAKEPG